MTFTLSFSLPGLPKTPNQLLGAHWTTRAGHARTWARSINLITSGKRPRAPCKTAKVTLTRHSSRKCDTDNLRGSFKAILDGLVKAGILADDTPEVIGEPVCLWEKAPPKKGKITVMVQEVVE